MGNVPGGFNLRFHPYFIPLQPSATNVEGGIRRIAFRFFLEDKQGLAGQVWAKHVLRIENSPKFLVLSQIQE